MLKLKAEVYGTTGKTAASIARRGDAEPAITLLAAD